DRADRDPRRRRHRPLVRGLTPNRLATRMGDKPTGDDPTFVDELTDPLAALPRYFGQAEYDPRSLRPVVGPAISAARRGALGLVGRALRVTAERQDRVNRLVTRMLEVLDQRSAPQVDRRLVALEELLRARASAEAVRELELVALAQSLRGPDEPPGVHPTATA